MIRVLLVVALGALALGLRWRAIERLPTDYDEKPYLTSAQELAGVLRSGELGALTRKNLQPEHPQLNQLLFAVALLGAEPSEPSPDRLHAGGGFSKLPEKELLAARTASGVFGALEVLLLACLSPLAGLLLALHTYTIKYTSLVMLEALPAATSLAAVASYQRFRRTEQPGWWIASAVLLGLSAAGKYMYAVAGIAILLDWALRAATPRAAQLRTLGLWAALSLAAFFVANPYLWPDPLWRLQFSLLYHLDYAAGTAETSYPMWQPFVWLVTSEANPARGAAIYPVRLDPLISLAALAGLGTLWRTQRVYALWLAIGFLFLLAWGTKWPHYVLILSAPLCLAAADGLQRLVAPVRALRARRRAGAPA